MIHESLEELASLYAFDLLDGEERARFETELARNSELQRLVAELRESTAVLAEAGKVPPPAALRSRLMASIEEGPRVTAPARTANRKLILLRTALPWGIAASLALMGFWSAQRASKTEAELALARAEADLATLGLENARNLFESERIVTERQLSELSRRVQADGELASLKIAALTSMLNHSPEALAVAVWNPNRQQGVLAVEKLPALAADQSYELWVIEAKPDAKPVSAGVFLAGSDGSGRIPFKPMVPVATVAKFAVSREQRDGAASHAQPREVVMISR